MSDERDELDDYLNGPIVPTRDLDVIERDALRREAIVIRARERKLAGLAREMAERIRPSHDGGPCLRVLSSDLDYWLRRYEEACK